MNHTHDAGEVIPQDILNTAEAIIESSLPDKSKKIYITVYDAFLDWMKEKGTNSYSEVVLLAYFKELSSTMLPSTLWSKYSMLRSMLKLEKDIDIETYNNLRQYLKKLNTGFEPKKSKILSPEDIRRYLAEAPDNNFLDIKTALVLGISGACRREELFNMTVDDVVDKGTHLIITIPKTKTNIIRTFTVDEPYREVVLKYHQKRKPDTPTKKFFMNYQNGQCTRQTMGINKIGGFPKKIAQWLELPQPELYTGYTFRRTSATLLANAGASITTLKRHGGWRSAQVAEGYIEDSITNKRKISEQIKKSIADTSNNTTPSNSTDATAAKIIKLDVNNNNVASSSNTIQMNMNSCATQ